jgi:hypothetical protein
MLAPSFGALQGNRNKPNCPDDRCQEPFRGAGRAASLLASPAHSLLTAHRTSHRDAPLLKTQYGLVSDAWRANLIPNCELRSLILFLG